MSEQKMKKRKKKSGIILHEPREKFKNAAIFIFL